MAGVWCFPWLEIRFVFWAFIPHLLLLSLLFSSSHHACFCVKSVVCNCALCANLPYQQNFTLAPSNYHELANHDRIFFFHMHCLVQTQHIKKDVSFRSIGIRGYLLWPNSVHQGQACKQNTVVGCFFFSNNIFLYIF
jgi:hypothetical protein